MRKLVFVIIAVAIMEGLAFAETTTIRLTQLENKYMTYSTKSTSFNFGKTFSYIGQARIKYVGTFYPGRAYDYFDGPSNWFWYGDTTQSKMDPPESAGYWIAYGGHDAVQAPFVEEQQFSWTAGGTPSWVFLLDGQAQVDTRLRGLFPLSWAILQEASAYINEAYLTIEEEIRQNNPNGGESLVSGTVKTISWTDFRGTSNYNIVYSIDNGATWTPVDSVSVQTSYDWIVPMSDSDNCRVRVIDAANANIYDTSDTKFSIHRLNYDLTGDLCYDFNDFAVLASYWMDNTCSSPGWCGGADFDHSGTVDSLDAATFTRYWLEEID